MMSILVLNGPNLNLLGRREPDIYGSADLEFIEGLCRKRAEELGTRVEFRQSNHEGELVDFIQSAPKDHLGLILNAAAYTHTSVALADAIKAIEIPAIEVHMSNIYNREPFRKHSYLSAVAVGSICGFGPKVYVLALDAMVSILNSE
ncbi:MAG: type II 3-dehydroquinate dehydratase [Rhodobacteraceae bacterium]|nr:type II 3-dehydroquinate dehydratase [Paracoccaceae bacterium]